MNQKLSKLLIFLSVLSVQQYALSLLISQDGTNFTRWTDDDWLETRFFIQKAFVFNRQPYEQLTIRSRLSEWFLELSIGNSSQLNRVWAGFHLYVNRLRSNSSLAYRVSVKHTCYPPIISSLTNDSNVRIPQLAEMDKLIAKYFTSDGIFRTINYMHCTINERRREPFLNLEMNIHLVTNREFQSLIYIDMSDDVRSWLSDIGARVFIHSFQSNFKFSIDLSNLTSTNNVDMTSVYMVKLYNHTRQITNGYEIRCFSLFIIFFNIVLIKIFL